MSQELPPLGPGRPVFDRGWQVGSAPRHLCRLVQSAKDPAAPVAPDDKDGEVHYRLATLYRKLGDRARAEEALATFKQLRAASQAASAGDLDLIEGEQEKEQGSYIPIQP